MLEQESTVATLIKIAKQHNENLASSATPDVIENMLFNVSLTKDQ